MVAHGQLGDGAVAKEKKARGLSPGLRVTQIPWIIPSMETEGPIGVPSFSKTIGTSQGKD